MEKKLTWEEIKKRYDQEWVELVDYDWPDGESHPRSGTLRSHAATRKSFICNADESLFLMIQQSSTWGHHECPMGSFFLRLSFGSHHASNNPRQCMGHSHR